MIKRFIDHARGAVIGAILASLILGCLAAPHIQWRLKAGNEPETLASVMDQSALLAAAMPGVKKGGWP